MDSWKHTYMDKTLYCIFPIHQASEKHPERIKTHTRTQLKSGKFCLWNLVRSKVPAG